jgi:hypothetical protein
MRFKRVCFATAGVFGLVIGVTAGYLTRMLSIVQRIVLPIAMAFVAAIGMLMMAGHLSSILEGWLDFPSDKSHTRQVLLVISRAYQTHGKGATQYIQTMPIWSNLEIEHEDFAFMRNHRGPGDDGRNPDEISSRGYFCAKLMIEESGKAVRILHSGSEKLPRGTIILCPSPPITQ